MKDQEQFIQKEELIQLVEYDFTNKQLIFSAKGEKFLRSIEVSFGTISISGSSKSGKSFLLNRGLLNQKKGFAVGNYNLGTKGIWIWSKPIYTYNEEGNKYPVYIIDCEGVNEDDPLEYSKLYSLLMIISSSTIFNTIGLIQDSTIMSMSFLLNISKHINLKSSFESERSPCEEISSILPNFTWVLRDCFKLLDENGESVSSKDYLENIMCNKDSYYNESEQKSKIKIAFSQYFKDKDCITLPKPTLSDSQLQILEILENDNLRQEFVNQLILLRKRLLLRTKEKTIKGKKINGENLSYIIKCYIQSVNSGQGMNFDNVWSQIVKQQNNRVVEECEKLYDKHFNDKINLEELTKENFRETHEVAKEKSLESFKKKVGENEFSNEFEALLKKKMNEKFKNLSMKTTDDLKTSLTIILENWITSIQYKLNSKEILSIFDIEKDIEIIEKKIFEGFESIPHKKEFLLYYKYKALFITSEYLIENNNTELNTINRNYEETINKLTGEKNQIQLNFESKFSKLNNINQSLKNENNELISQNKVLKDNYKYMKDEKEAIIKSLNEKLEETKFENLRFIGELESKNSNVEEKSKEIFKKYMKENTELLSEKKLLEQKLEQLSLQVDDANKRDKETANDYKIQLREQTNATRESTQRYEDQISQLKKQVEADKDRILDLESLLQNNEFIYENEKVKNESKVNKLEKELNDLRKKMSKQTEELENEKENLQNKSRINEAEYLKKTRQFMCTIEELENKLKLNEEKQRNSLDLLEKENAILKQNTELFQSQVNELQTQIKEHKQFNDNIMMKIGNNYEEEFSLKKEEMRVEALNQKKLFEEELDKTKKSFLNQISNLNQRMSLQEAGFEKERVAYVKDYSKLKESFDKLKKDLELSLLNNKTITNTITFTNEEFTQKYKSLINEYEGKLEEQGNRYQNNLMDLAKENEESINQLKRLLEGDKKKFEEKMREESESNDNKMKKLMIEYENKLSEKDVEYQNQLDILQHDLNEQINNFNLYESNAEQIISSLKQEVESLKNYLNESKENFNKLQEDNNYHLGNHLENMKRERNEFILKIEMLSSDLSAKLKENINLGLRNNKLENTIKDNEDKKENIIKMYELEKRDLQEKLELYKKKSEETSEELMIKKLEFSRENALLKQQVEFHEKKKESLQIQLTENQKNYEERLFSLRNEIEKSFQDKLDKLLLEKEIIENKVNQKKKEIRDIQTNNLKGISHLEKEKAILIEKIGNLERNIKDLMTNNEKEVEKLNNTIHALKDEIQHNNEKYLKEGEQLKNRIIILEFENKEKLTVIEKERLLFESKYKFLESQKEHAKKEFLDYQGKFETTLENLQKKALTEKEKYENNYKNLLITIKTKYQNELKEMSDTNQKLYSELISLNKEIDEEFSNINTYFDNQEKLKNEMFVIEDKLIEISQVNENLKRELELTKNDRDKKLNEIINSFTTEKDALKEKVLDLMDKNADYERKKSKTLVEQEREKTKFFLDKEKYEGQIRTLLEQVDKLEMKNQILLKENDRLRTDKNDLLINNFSYKRISSYVKNNIGNSSTGFDSKNNLISKTSIKEKSLTPGRNKLKSTNSSPKQRLDRSSNFEKSPDYTRDDKLKRSYGNN